MACGSERSLIPDVFDKLGNDKPARSVILITKSLKARKA